MVTVQIAYHVAIYCGKISYKATMIMEENGSLPFLDTLIWRNDSEMIDTCVYRKHAHTDRYLQYSSHHPNHVKRSMVSGLYHRARVITQGESKAAEEQHLTRVLMENGYPHEVVRTASQVRHRMQCGRGTAMPYPLHSLCVWPWRGSQEDLQEV